jgi:LysR family transcriptional regulator, transcriptional activator of the cysJI operon
VEMPGPSRLDGEAEVLHASTGTPFRRRTDENVLGDVTTHVLENFRIRVFRTVAHHLNFSRAAEELLLTQPAITQQVKALEDELEVPLFDRSGGRITLTAAGKALLPFADKMKEVSDQAFTAVAETSGEQAGELALGASQTIAQYLLPNFVAAFVKAHPRIRIVARSGNTDQILDAL